jgi:hypothetical protein
LTTEKKFVSISHMALEQAYRTNENGSTSVIWVDTDSASPANVQIAPSRKYTGAPMRFLTSDYSDPKGDGVNLAPAGTEISGPDTITSEFGSATRISEMQVSDFPIHTAKDSELH